MSLNKELGERCQNNCEICNTNDMVALCDSCHEAITSNNLVALKDFASGRIWNPVAPIQALSYRIIHGADGANEATDLAGTAGLDE